MQTSFVAKCLFTNAAQSKPRHALFRTLDCIEKPIKQYWFSPKLTYRFPMKKNPAAIKNLFLPFDPKLWTCSTYRQLRNTFFWSNSVASSIIWSRTKTPNSSRQSFFDLSGSSKQKVNDSTVSANWLNLSSSAPFLSANFRSWKLTWYWNRKCKSWECKENRHKTDTTVGESPLPWTVVWCSQPC